jgi:hypothetical protein
MPARDFVPVALIKLVVHPLLVCGRPARRSRRGAAAGCVHADQVMVLVAALPSASNVSLLAERFGADTGRIARIILLTTAAAFLTFRWAPSFWTAGFEAEVLSSDILQDGGILLTHGGTAGCSAFSYSFSENRAVPYGAMPLRVGQLRG